MTTPKWMVALSETLERFPKYKTFALSSLEGHVPHVRYIIHRSFLSQSSNTPLIVATTDIRSPKVAQLTAETDIPNAEVAWWIEEPNEQYRFTARAYILPRPSHNLRARFPAQRLIPSSEKADDVWDWWEKERINTFNNKMGGALRASFCRPPPGSELPGGYDAGKDWPEKVPSLEEAEEGSKDEENAHQALQNFALLVLAPLKVDRIELNVVPNRRTSWTLQGDEWLEKILVP